MNFNIKANRKTIKMLKYIENSLFYKSLLWAFWLVLFIYAVGYLIRAFE